MRHKFFLPLFLVLFSFFSCSDSEPKVIASSAYVIMEYPDEESLPTQRLCVFVETSSDVHRAQSLEILNRDTDFQWKCDKPVIFSNDKRQWAGCTEFVGPYNTEIPTGFYDIKYIDAQERSFDSLITVNYSKDFLNLKAGEVISNIKGRYREQIAVYTKDNILCYYGDIREQWKDEKKIFSAHSGSAWYRKCIVVTGTSLICMMPPRTKADVDRDSAEN